MLKFLFALACRPSCKVNRGSPLGFWELKSQDKPTYNQMKEIEKLKEKIKQYNEALYKGMNQKSYLYEIINLRETEIALLRKERKINLQRIKELTFQSKRESKGLITSK